MKIIANNYTSQEIIRIIREWTELSQREFGKTIHRSESGIQAYELGNRNYSMQTLIEIANTHGLTITIAKKIEIGLKKTKLPENTEIIDSISIAGKLVGNGNGMQYFGAILVKTNLSEFELNEYYKQYRNKEWEYNIKEQKSEKIDVIEIGNYSFKNFRKDEQERCYIIYSWGSSKNALLDIDIRGH